MNPLMRTLLRFCTLFLAMTGLTMSAEPGSGNSRWTTTERHRRAAAYWLANMAAHRFTTEEVGLVFGIPKAEASALVAKSNTDPSLTDESIA